MDSQPEILAQHYAEAGLVDKSVIYWSKAGHRSAAHSAMTEAAAQFQKGLDQLVLLPDTTDRKRQELELRSGVGAVLRFVKGQAAPETGQAYARARELWEQLDFPTKYLHVPYGESRYHSYRGELDLARRLDGDLLRVSHQRNDSGGLVLAHQACGSDQMIVGRFAPSRQHYEAALALYDPVSHHSLGHQTGSHPQVVARAYLGFVLLCLGLPDQASTQTNTAIAEARTLANPPSLASSLMVGAMLLSLVGDNRALNERADELVAVAVEQGVPWWHTVGTVYRGWVKVNHGDVTEGISLIHSGLTAYRDTGAEMWVPYHIALCASACEIAGQIEESSALLDDALRLAERTGERWFAAELNRHKGQLLLRQGHTEGAEDCIGEHSALPGSRRPRCGNCAPPRAWPGFAATKAATPKPATCFRWSMAGSPKASTHRTSRRPKRCSTDSGGRLELVRQNVTGSESGLGAATAVALARGGARVIVNTARSGEAEETADLCRAANAVVKVVQAGVAMTRIAAGWVKGTDQEGADRLREVVKSGAAVPKFPSGISNPLCDP